KLVDFGKPVGVQDLNQDGAADDTHFIDGAVGIECSASGRSIPVPIAVPIDLSASYWNPSGNQNRPAVGGFDALGPKVFLNAGGALPTSPTCGLVFSPDVVDKQGNQVCAPPGGDLHAGCKPGDVSAFSFGVEPLALSNPRPTDGQQNVARNQTLMYSL